MSNPFLQKASNRFSALNDDNSSTVNKIRKNDNTSNKFKNIVKIEEKKEINLVENFDQLFPETIKISKNKINETTESSNFLEAINKEVIIDKNIDLSPINNEPTYDKDKDPNYIMTKAINLMEYYWDLDRRFYDHMHGEGAYDELYCMDAVYSDSDDSDDDLYEEEDEEDDDQEYY